MADKQMEGDNQRRRARARLAREEGRKPSEAGGTLGASKQPLHEEHAHRSGPPPAGAHKPVPHDPANRVRTRPAPEWPHSVERIIGAEDDTEGARIRYRDLVTDVGRRLDLSFDEARLACEATITVLARALPDGDRQRFLSALPDELHDDYPVELAPSPVDLAGFLGQVATIVHRPPEQARYRAQAVVGGLDDRDRGLLDSVALPDYLTDLRAPLPAGGGVVDPAGGVPPLTDEELAEALARLPLWSGDHRALTRTVVLPPENLERVLGRLAALKRELGRGPDIVRDAEDSATLVVRTSSVDAVTALDVGLARSVDAAVEEAGAGMSAG
jgi:pterin-4a-carbinolamine dehydratase